MALKIDIPEIIEASLREKLLNADAAAKEACLVEFYRQGQLTHQQLASALGLGRYATDGVLKHHGVGYELTVQELQRQIAVIAEDK